jgi:hypothetical protein
VSDNLAAALAEYDATMAGCPVNYPKHGKVYGPKDRCEHCNSIASGMCGKAITAGWHLQKAVRSMVMA